VWCKNTHRHPMPAPGHPRPQTVPPARRTEPGRASRAKEWKFQNGELDDRGYRRTKVAAIACAVLCEAHEDKMSRKTKPAFVGEVLPRRPPVRVRTRRITATFSKLYPADGEGKIWWGRLKKALGTSSSDFVVASLHQLQAAAQFPGSGISETGINAALALIEGFAPQNEVEAALAVQMACTHIATMSVVARLGSGTGPDDRTFRFASATARLLRAFTTQFETYRRLRHGGDQYVRVEHVHINEGAQAVIGNVHPQDGGRAQLAGRQVTPDDHDKEGAP
jgi:hypothetical protein